ncbi:MAG: thioredoxin domain-containing protein [Nanohaloarchaea archaeon]|nr:thioredoxin domain-containing protein [Candidatus Nanohaloarchaea archaeon]
MAEKKAKKQARPKKTAAANTKKKTVPPKKTDAAKKTIKKETIVKKNPAASLQKYKNTWMLSTAVLAILLIASLFTGGFDFRNKDQNTEIDCIDTLLDSAIASETKTALSTAKDELISALEAEKEVMPTNTVDDSDKPVTLDMYIMSQCPYGVQAEDGAIPAVKRLIDSVDYNIYFIVNENGDGTFSSLHGQPEVDENLRQICIDKKYPDQFLDYLTCLNKNYRNAESAWKACASAYGIDTDEISACQTGDEGKSLLSESAKKAKSVGASGSPTIYINDRPYQQGRDTQSFTRAICQLAPENPACDSMPACSTDADCIKTGFIGTCVDADTENAKCEYTQLPVVNIKILNDETCDGCDTTAFNSINEQIFINTEITTVDVSTDEGKALLEEIDPQLIPVYLFDETVLESSEYARLAQFFTKKGEYYMLSSDIVSQYISSPKLVGRDTIANKLDLFVMSECPYGVQAVNNMEEVIDTFGDTMDFSIHFIATDNGDGTFSSLHGQKEVNENIRQVCAIKYAEDTYFDYILCQNKNYEAGQDLDTTWEACATETSIDIETMDTCSNGDEGKELLRANIALTDELGIGSSPTFLVNNQVKFGGALPADEIKTNFCAENPDTKDCDATLSTNTNITPSGTC